MTPRGLVIRRSLFVEANALVGMTRNVPDPRRWWALALLCGAFFMVTSAFLGVVVLAGSDQREHTHSRHPRRPWR
jgi:hypothetical protein